MTNPRLDRRFRVVPTLTGLQRNENVKSGQGKVSTRGTMNMSSQVTRRSVLVGAGALTVAGALGSSTTSARLTAPPAASMLSIRRLMTLTRLQEIARQYPHPTARVATPGDVRRNSRDIQDRFQALRASQQLQVRRGADWWGKNLDLTRLSRTHHVLASLDLNELSVATRDSVLWACSLALAGLVPGMRGTNNSVSALWVSGLSKEGVGPWHHA